MPGRGGISLDGLADLVAVLLRHHDVGEDEIGPRLAHLLERPGAVADAGQLVVAVGERQFDDFLDRQAVVGQQNLFWHRGCKRDVLQ